MDTVNRQMDLKNILDQYMKENPQFVEALELFEIGQEQYASALAHINATVIISSTTTNLGVDNAKLDRNKS